jgi:hypothetical protein
MPQNEPFRVRINAEQAKNQSSTVTVAELVQRVIQLIGFKDEVGALITE